jgi:hypothetical protein
VLTRMTIAAGTLGASLAFAGSALAAPSPFMAHGRRHAAHHQLVHKAVTPATTTGAKLYVNGGSGSDRDGANTCRLSGNPCATIGHAISVAPTTATIEVAGGTYPEQLTITNKNLTINGAGSTRTIIDPATLQTDTNDPNTTSPQAVIVEFLNTGGGGLSNLTVSGSGSGQSEPSDGACDQDFVGVEFANATGTLGSDAVTGIQEQQADFGCQQGLSVYVANNDGTAAVTMKTLAVTNYQKDGIDCADSGTTCTISGSTVTGIGPTGLTAQNGIEADAGVTASIKGSTITGNSYTSPDYTTNGMFYTGSGILAYDTTNLTVSSNKVNNNDENIVGYNDGTGPAQGTWLISKNTVTAATNDTGAVPLGDSVGDGIDLYGTGGAGSSTDVYGNTVNNNADWGIALFGALDATVGGTATGERNTLSQNADDGIFLGEFSPGLPSSNNTVTNNLVKGNKDDGILAAGPDSSNDQQATGNTFLSNLLQTNVRYDAEDLSTPSGGVGAGKPGQTANTWTNNVCKPAKDSNPLGLCS